MPRVNLPYPGYSWGMSQHVGCATDRPELFALLDAAALYGDDEEDYRERITEQLIEVFPPNVREDAGRPQIWRDYQQILAELGLIVSTRVHAESVIITPIGLMWLDGMMGYSEVMTTQALRYQYPNGHKQDVSASLKNAFEQAGRTPPVSRAIADIASGVRIKPGVLLLRVLLELTALGTRDLISAQECLQCLVPVARNEDWPEGMASLRALRSGTTLAFPGNTSRALRHVQEWFDLLGMTELFVGTRSEIGLSELAKERLEELAQLCEYHETPSSFWEPASQERRALAQSWFDYFGTPDLAGQWLVPADFFTDTDFVATNYPAGISSQEEMGLPGTPSGWSPEINLRPLSEPDVLSAPAEHDRTGQLRLFTRPVRVGSSGFLRQHVIAALGRRLESLGGCVQHDPRSVDVLSAGGETEVIFVVKSVTPRSLASQVRLGVGQLCEYRYRRCLQTGCAPRGILVLNAEANLPQWLIDFFEEEVELGLVTLTGSASFRAYTGGDMELRLARI